MPSIERKAFAVSLVTQGRWRFYTLTMPSDVLANCCYVSDRFKDPHEGFQRRLEKPRAEDIARYIDSGLGTIPNAVILSAQPDANLQVTGKGKTIRFDFVPKAFLVLDGQHRVYGYWLAKNTLRVPVVVYNNLTRQEEVRLFIDINTKQRPVPNELLLDIKRLATYENAEEKLLGELFDEFHQNPTSALFGLTSSSERAAGKISRVTFNNAMRAVLPRFSDQTKDRIYATLNMYFGAVLQHFEAKGISATFSQPVVFRALLELFPRVAQRVVDRHKNQYKQTHFFEVLEPVFKRVTKATFQKPGTSYKSLGEKLIKRLDKEALM